MRHRRDRPRPVGAEAAVPFALAALVALAFLLRLDGLDESLMGDELYTHRIVSGTGLGDVLEAVSDSAITPPLHYLLAWGSVQLGDDEIFIRLPSLVLGTATVLTVYLLARRIEGGAAALLAAALIAIDPFAVFFSTEARAYATLMFLVTLSTLALLHAIESRRAIWWALYAVASVCALYTHYTAAIPLVVQVLGAVDRAGSNPPGCGGHRSHLPRVPALDPGVSHDQAGGTAQIAAVHPLSVESVGQASGRLLFGQPLADLHESPGPPRSWVFTWRAAAGAALVGGGERRRGPSATPAWFSSWRWPSPGLPWCWPTAWRAPTYTRRAT